MQVSGQMRNVKIYYKVNARKVVQVSGQMQKVLSDGIELKKKSSYQV